MNKQLRSVQILILLTFTILLVSCGTFSITTELKKGEDESTEESIQLATPVSMQPAAGICPEGQGDIVTVKVNPDVPEPRCLQVRSDQRLSVFNGLEVTLEISLGQLSATIESGGEYTFDAPLGQILLPGVHVLGTSSCCGGEIFLKGDQGNETMDTGTVTEAPLPLDQGNLKFPYIAADAGNFSIQAGEEIVITWNDAPLGAETYEIKFIRSDEVEVNLTLISTQPPEGIVAVWAVPGRESGRLEGVARYANGEEVRSGCCSQIFTGDLPPKGYCSLRIHGIGVQNLYQESNSESPRIAGIAPGLYLEVLGRTMDNWFLVETDQVITPAGSDPVDITGWINGQEQVSLHGPCDAIPITTD